MTPAESVGRDGAGHPDGLSLQTDRRLLCGFIEAGTMSQRLSRTVRFVLRDAFLILYQGHSEIHSSLLYCLHAVMAERGVSHER
jgi:hypothetical protein